MIQRPGDKPVGCTCPHPTNRHMRRRKGDPWVLCVDGVNCPCYYRVHGNAIVPIMPPPALVVR